MKKDKIYCRVFALICGLCFASGCASYSPEPAMAERLPAWPPPPSRPRISFVRSVYSLKDLGVKLSTWRRVLNFIASDDRGVEGFVKPLALSVDDEGNLCIVDHGAGKVVFYNKSSRRCMQWRRIGEYSLLSPVSFVKQGDTFFVADTQLGRVLAFDIKGRVLFEMKEGIKRPSGLAISGDKLFVAETKKKMPIIYKELLVDRNNNWLPMIDAYGETPEKEFVLVGAAHLVGPDGIVKALRDKGYRVEKL